MELIISVSSFLTFSGQERNLGIPVVATVENATCCFLHIHIPLDSFASEEKGSSYFNLSTSPLFIQYEYEDLYKILDILSPEDKEILLRRYVGGEKPSHIAKDLGVPTKSIVNNLYRSKNKLKTLITSGGNL